MEFIVRRDVNRLSIEELVQDTARAIYPGLREALEKGFPPKQVGSVATLLLNDWRCSAPVRAVLARLGFEIAGRRPFIDVLDAGVSIELTQLATLVLDDVIDCSDLRNGPSAPSAFGLGASVMAGEILKSMATGLLLASARHKRENGRWLAAGAELEAMYEAISMGQMLDMLYESREKISETQYFAMIGLGTGRFLASSIAIGAILAGAPDALLSLLRAYGMHLGLAFQLYDDVLDLKEHSNQEKPFANDIKRHKKRLPLIHFMRAAPARDRQFAAQLFSRPMDDGAAREVIGLMNRCGSIEYTLRKARIYCARARADVRSLANYKLQRQILQLVDFMQSDDPAFALEQSYHTNSDRAK